MNLPAGKKPLATSCSPCNSRKRKCGARLRNEEPPLPCCGDSVLRRQRQQQRQSWGKNAKLHSKALFVADSVCCLHQRPNQQRFGETEECVSHADSEITKQKTCHQRGRGCFVLNSKFWALLLAWGLPCSTLAIHTKGENTWQQNQRNLQLAAPPENPVEDDVTVFPTGTPTFAPPTSRPTPWPTYFPTPRPTFRPTPRPTFRPTPRPTFRPTGTIVQTSAPSTSSPTQEPSPSPTWIPTQRPTISPTNTQTFEPTRLRTERPTTAPPTNLPTLRPSFMPLSPGETRGPSPEPTTNAPTDTLQPTMEMATAYTAEEATESPTAIVWQKFVVEDAVQVFLELPATQRASPAGLANIWQDYIESTLRVVYANEDDVVRVTDVLVLVDGQGASPAQRDRLLQQEGQQADRIVQSFLVETTVDLEKNPNDASGGDNLNGTVEGLVENLLSADNLQDALNDANVEGVGVVAVTAAEPSRNRGGSQSSSKDKPNQIELIIGFALVGIMAAMLAITAHSRIKTIRKRRKRRRLAKLREQNSYVMPKQERPLPPNSPAKSKDVDVFIDDDDDDSVDDIIGTYMIDEESYPSNLPTAATSDDASDPFANELKQAAVMDDEAWKRLQRKKEELRKRGRVVDSMYTTAVGSGEEGVEIGATTLAGANFPYGVDKNSVGSRSIGATSPSTPQPIQSPVKQQLSPGDAVRWTTAGLALNIIGRESSQVVESRGSFEPYGESKKEPSLQESWDLDEPPKEEQFGQYSFMNPLRPRSNDRSNDTANARASPTEFSEDPSAIAIRASMSVSSWSEADGVDLRASPTESMIPLGMIREQSSDSQSDQVTSAKDESYGTMDMLEEVQRLSAYVRNYEKKKTIKQSLGSSTPGGGSSVSYDAMSDSVSAKRAGRRDGSPPSRLTKVSYRQAAAVNNTTSMDSSGFGIMESSSELSGVSDTEDDASTRLGISRFSIQTPSNSALLYSVEELPMPAMASREEEEDAALLMSISPGRGLSMENSRDISGPLVPDRPRSPIFDSPEDEKSGNLGTPRQGGGKLEKKVGRGKLSKLRGTGNMLDGEEKSEHTNPSDEFTREERRDAALRRPSPPPVRSTNRGFTNIISMFESKPATPIAPPNEGWQHGIKNTPKK